MAISTLAAKIVINCSESLTIYLFNSTRLINSVQQEHSCTIIYLKLEGKKHILLQLTYSALNICDPVSISITGCSSSLGITIITCYNRRASMECITRYNSMTDRSMWTTIYNRKVFSSKTNISKNLLQLFFLYSRKKISVFIGCS